MSSELDHPCRQTCSGWKQGHERGVKDGMERAAKIVEQINCPNEWDERKEALVDAAFEIRADAAKEPKV